MERTLLSACRQCLAVNTDKSVRATQTGEQKRFDQGLGDMRIYTAAKVLDMPPASLSKPEAMCTRLRLACWMLVAMAAIGLPHLSVAQQEPEQNRRDRLIQQLAKSSDPEDQLALAVAYSAGAVNGKRDYAKAFDLLTKSAAQNYAPAEYSLGLAYKWGHGHPIDNHAAMMWFKKSANAGYALAQAQMGDIYSEGANIPRDDKEALTWYRKAAAHGDARSMRILGVAYLQGRTAARDVPTAVAWLQRSCQKDDSQACYLLATTYEHGSGVPKDGKKAFAYFQRAANGYCIEAFYELGMLYQEGEGVQRDQISALMWLELSADSGDERGEYMAATVSSYLSKDQVQEAHKRTQALKVALLNKPTSGRVPGGAAFR